MIPELIRIAGGTFLMGSEEGGDDEKPVHKVTVDSFFIGKYAITNQQYDAYLHASKYSSLPPFRKDPHFDHPMQPVVGVSWFDAVAYCRWLSELTGNTYRLSSEAEWEFASKSNTFENIYPWGTKSWNEWPELHYRFQNGPERVGSFEPNPWGIYEMGMNVHEWCLDWYDAGYYHNSPPLNPRGPEYGKRRASRGGSWRHMIKITRCAARSSIPPEMRYADYGFRVVREIQ